MFEARRILVLAPHTDDGELGAGASISKWVRRGREVFYAAFSGCENVVPQGLAQNTLRLELAQATGVLGISPDRLIVLDHETRSYWSRRQDILDSMLQLRRDIRPDVVLAPALSDIHQDHEVIARESLRAFKGGTVLGYEMPWNNTEFAHTVYSPVEEQDVDRKVEALACYRSQANRPYLSPEFTRAQLVFRGVQIGTSFAEMFDTRRIVLS